MAGRATVRAMGPLVLGPHGARIAEARPAARSAASGSDLVPRWADLAPSAHADIRDLDPFARVLATTDGTVTEILEAWAAEQVAIGRVSQRRAPLGRTVEALRAGTGVM